MKSKHTVNISSSREYNTTYTTHYPRWIYLHVLSYNFALVSSPTRAGKKSETQHDVRGGPYLPHWARLSRRKTPVRRQAEVVAPPIREGDGVARGAEQGKVEDEDDDLGAAVERRGDDVVVLGEPAGVARAHPPLGEDAERHGGVDLRVDADGHVAGVLQDDGGVEVLEACFRPEAVLRIGRIRQSVHKE